MGNTLIEGGWSETINDVIYEKNGQHRAKSTALWHATDE